jgi:hypothetical protein
MKPGSDEDLIVARLDARPAPPIAAAKIALGILALVRAKDEIVVKAIMLFRNSDDALDVKDAIGRQIRRHLDDEKNTNLGMYRLAYTVLFNVEQLDGYLAEYLFDWARENHVSDQDTFAIFERILAQYD